MLFFILTFDYKESHLRAFTTIFLIPNIAIFQMKTGTGKKWLGKLSVV